ncbi:MAG: hypothetical protein DHS20C18_25810 [Saprospiraceae bacterium]|nr:MAG: hypothetical protein DHS20C18_25810 [Saprospiraceae bacterium]
MQDIPMYSVTIDLVKILIVILVILGGSFLAYFYKIGYKNKPVFMLLIVAILALINVYALKFYSFPVPDFVTSLGFLFGPLFYFSTRFFVDKQLAAKRNLIKHTLLSMLLFGLALFEPIHTFLTGLTYLHFGVYLMAGALYLFAHKKQIGSIEKRHHGYHLLGAILISFLSIITEGLLTRPVYAFRISIVVISFGAGYLLIRYILLKVRKLWKHYKIAGQGNDQSPTEKYKDSILSRQESQRLAKALESLMKRDKLYLHENISLNTLAEKLAIHPKHLSQVINENFQQNFFDFINSYRIEAAKDMLRDGQFRQHKIYEIMYAVGFNSRSSFNAAFKKSAGLTASQYRENFLST